MKRRSITAEFKYGLMLVTAILVVTGGVAWYFQTREIFRMAAEHLSAHEDGVAVQMAEITSDEVWSYINYSQETLLDRLKQNVKERIGEAYAQAVRIYDEGQGVKTEAQLRQDIREALRSDRFFDGTGYYFIDTLQGEVVLFPTRPELEGTNILEMKDIRGQKTVQEEIRIVKEAGEGFVSGYWPRPNEPDTSGSLKVTYVKRFEPFDWYIGTGQYFEDLRETVKTRVVERYKDHNPGEHAGAWVYLLDRSGTEIVPRLSAEAQQGAGGQDVAGLVREELANALRNPAGYSYIREDANGVRYAVSLRTYAPWGWVLGAEVPIGAPYPVGGLGMEEARAYAAEVVLKTLVLLVSFMGIGLWVVRKRMRTLRGDMMAFMAFFKRAAGENSLIRVEDIQLEEFVSMANLANEMVLKRQEMDSRLKELNTQLEQLVETRTAELQDSRETLESTQEILLQTERFNDLGRMAAGFTHEIATPLGICRTLNSDIGDLLDTIREAVGSGQMKRMEMEAQLNRLAQDTQLIEANLDRAVSLIRGFSTVSVDQCSGERRQIQLREYLNDIALSAEALVREGEHRIEVICDEDLILDTYPGALFQILTNLISNSVLHGFQQKRGGHITLEAIGDGGHVLLRYQDDGVGVPDTHRSRVFEPFFTTARDQGGSGLGLSIVHQLVTEKLKGTVNFSSKEGRGVLLEIELPLQVE